MLRRDFLKGAGALLAFSAAPIASAFTPASGGYVTIAQVTEYAATRGCFMVGEVVEITLGTRSEFNGFYTITAVSPQSYTVEVA